jgi:hypothetical protein
VLTYRGTDPSLTCNGRCTVTVGMHRGLNVCFYVSAHVLVFTDEESLEMGLTPAIVSWYVS